MRVATLDEIRDRTQRELAAYKQYGHSPNVTHLEFAVVLKALDDALAVSRPSPATECSVCRRVHGLEVQHPCE